MINFNRHKNILIALCGLIMHTYLLGQMGIGVSVPHASAGLEILSANKGLLIPRVALVGPNDGTTIPFGAPTGLWVYNTNAAMAGGGGVGFYYNANEGNPSFRNWVKMQTGLSSTATWNVTGNASIDAGSNFLGTTDNKPLVFGYGSFQQGVIRKVGFLIPQTYSYYFNRIPAKLDATAHFCIGVGTGSVGGNNTDDGRIGFGTGANNDIGNLNRGDFSIAIGDSALMGYKRANGAVLIGKNAGKQAEFASDNTGIGYDVLKNTVAEGNTAFGSSALREVVGEFVNIGVGNGGFFNTGLGYRALQYGTDIQRNTIVGFEAGGTAYTGNIAGFNTAIGSEALKGNNSGSSTVNMSANVALGYKTMGNARLSGNNTAVGMEALLACGSCSNNVAIGFKAMTELVNGNQNTAVGASAAAALASGGLNTAAGTGSLGGVTTGSFNTAIGFLAYPVGNYSNSVVIGFLRNVNSDNQVRFGNTSVTSIGGQVAWTALSDGRAKSDIREDVPGLALLQQLNPVTYHLNRVEIEKYTHLDALRAQYHLPAVGPDLQRHTGLEAQKLDEALRKYGENCNLVDVPQNKDGLYGIRYELMVVPLVKTIQEQQAMIKTLETQIAESENLLHQIKAL